MGVDSCAEWDIMAKGRDRARDDYLAEGRDRVRQNEGTDEVIGWVRVGPEMRLLVKLVLQGKKNCVVQFSMNSINILCCSKTLGQN